VLFDKFIQGKASFSTDSSKKLHITDLSPPVKIFVDTFIETFRSKRLYNLDEQNSLQDDLMFDMIDFQERHFCNPNAIAQGITNLVSDSEIQIFKESVRVYRKL